MDDNSILWLAFKYAMQRRGMALQLVSSHIRKKIEVLPTEFLKDIEADIKSVFADKPAEDGYLEAKILLTAIKRELYGEKE